MTVLEQQEERLCGTMLARLESRKDNPLTEEEIRQSAERVKQQLYESTKSVLSKTLQENRDLKEELEWLEIDEVEKVLTHDDLKELWHEVKDSLREYMM